MKVKKRTIGVVVGVVVVVMVGVGIRFLGNSEEDRETIEIAECLLNEDSEGFSWVVTVSKVTYDGPNKRTVHGVVPVNKDNINIHAFNTGIPLEYDVVLEKRSGEWSLYNIQGNSYESLWDRIIKFVTSFLP